jgi:hypothetical protein
VRARVLHTIQTLCCALALLLAAAAHAQEPAAEIPDAAQTEPPDEAESEPPGTSSIWTPWRPKPPEPRQYDWIQLVSGEWLKGDITIMRDDVMEFDSDELDDLEIDWDKVKQLRSPRVHTFVFDGRRVITGVGRVTEDEVIIQVVEKRVVRFGQDELEENEKPVEQTLVRKELMTIIPGKPSELNFWSGKLSLGVAVRKGNTDQQDLSGLAWLRRESSLTRLRFDYNGAISLVDGAETTNNHRANAKFDVYLSRRFYVTPALIEIYADPFSNIAYRITPTVGVGYKIFLRKSFEWEVDGGAGYQFTEFKSPPASGVNNEGTASLRVGTDIESEITDKIDFDLNYTFQLGVPDVSNRTHHLLILNSYEITRFIDLDISFTWDRVANPVPGEGGTSPEPDDYRLSIGLGLDF